MQMHLLLTDDIRATMPPTTKITDSWGNLLVMFGGDLMKNKYGLHCFVEDTEENLTAWLKPFDGFVKGNGNPMMETFEICHIK